MIDVAALLTHAVVSATANNQFFSGGFLLGILAAIAAYARSFPAKIKRWLLYYLTLSVEIDNRDTLFEVMQSWMHVQDFNTKARDMVASLTYLDRTVPAAEKNKPRLVLTPAPGRHWAWRKGTLLSVTIAKEKVQGGSDAGGRHSKPVAAFHETIVIRAYLCFNKQRLIDLIEEARELEFGLTDDKVKIYTYSSYRGWHLHAVRVGRNLASLVLAEGLLDSIVADFKDFFESQKWYQDRSIPWKRGYLLYGPAGSGKTSIVMALASKFKRDIYYMNLAEDEMSDAGLNEKMGSIPASSIIVLEEIDTIFRGRKAANGRGTGLSFGGLLNALDGLTSKEGRIIVMTTNHRELLDPALIRPGRADLQLYIGRATNYQIKTMFERFYEEHKHLAVEFANRIPEDVISMAGLQEYFMEHKSNPEAALENSHKLVGAAIEARKHAEEQARAEGEAAVSVSTDMEEEPIKFVSWQKRHLIITGRAKP